MPHPWQGLPTTPDAGRDGVASGAGWTGLQGGWGLPEGAPLVDAIPLVAVACLVPDFGVAGSEACRRSCWGEGPRRRG